MLLAGFYISRYNPFGPMNEKDGDLEICSFSDSVKMWSNEIGALQLQMSGIRTSEAADPRTVLLAKT